MAATHRRPTILVVEDEESIAEPLAEALQRDGFEPVLAGTVAAALERLEAGMPDLVLLDVMLPDGDGRDVLRRIRSSSATPVIMLTARGEETDRVVGLELGADDYVTKPFSAAELSARIRAVLRRAGAREQPADEAAAQVATLAVGGVRLDPETRRATLEGDELELTLKEFELLRVLMESAGRVVRRERLMAEVWDTTWLGSTKTLDVHVSGLRRKLGDDPSDPRYLQTVRGVGFRFQAPSAAEG
jgi:DNA-binding response OmpR family regulator